MAESRLSIVIDSRSAEQRAQDVRRALQALEDAGVRVTAATGNVSSAMGHQASQASVLTRNVNSTRNALQRMQQAQQSIKSGQKGLFQPVQAERYAASVDRAASATRRAARDYNRAGLSARQLRQAQQQLPMQFTDIFTSLASGQPAMQVFLQQGGQLKDIFGGVGPALRGMAGYIAGLINPLTLAAGSATALVVAFESGRDEAQQFNKTLTMTGQQSGATTDELMTLAAQMDSLADTTQNRAAAALNQVVKSGKFTAEQFETVTRTAILMENATGQAIDKTIEQFGKIADDPVDAITELNEQYNFLTVETYENIRALAESGREMEAQRVAMNEYADTMRDRASDITGDLGTIERAAYAVADAFKEMWDQALAVGRTSASSRIEKLSGEIATLSAATDEMSTGGALSLGATAEDKELLAQKKLQLAAAVGQLAQEQAIAEEKRDQAEATQDHIEASERQARLVEGNLTTQREIAKVEKDIAFLRERQAQASSDEERQKIGETIKALQDKKQGIIESTDAYRAQQRAQKEAEREAERLAQAYDSQASKLARQIALFGETGEAAKVRYEIEHGALQDVSEARKESLVQRAEEVDRLKEQAKEQKKYEDQVESILDSYDSQHRKMQELRQAVETLNRAYKDPEVEMSFQQYQRALAGIREEMREVARESDPVAKEMARAWEEAADRIDETFADAFAGAFDSFDDFADQLLDGFKRLLGELAYQATLKPIVVDFTADMKSALGIGSQGGLGGSGGGFGGIPGLGTAANKAAGWLGLGGSSVGAAGTAAIGYGSGFGAAAGTGAYTGWAGSAAAGAATSGGMMGAIGSAMPWVGGAMLVDNLLDLGIVDGIVGGISDALGISGKYAGEDPTGLIATRNQFGSAGRSGWERDAMATGALGDIGFAPDSRDIDTLFGDRDNFENAKAYAEQLAQLDNTVAQLAESEAELNAMREAAADQGLTNMSDIEGRYTAILDTLDGEFGEFVQGIDGSIEEVVQKGVTARQAFTSLSDASERLDLRFDDTTAAAYEAASSLAEMAGGTQQLTSLQQNYYQTLYSEEERLNQLRSDVTQQLNAMGMSLPRSRDGFRELVEAQDLNTEAGQRNYTQLLQLVDSFDRLADSGALVNAEVAKLDDQIASLKDDVKSAWETFDKQSFDQRISLLELAGESEQALALQRERELEAMDASLRPFQERFWALQDEKEAQQEATQAGQEYAQALASARDSLGSTFDSISSYLDQLRSTDKGGGTPREQLTAARSAFNEQLQLARSGDRTALQNITQYADRLIDAQRGWSASGGATSNIIERIENQLGNLPDQVSAEQFIADEIKAALIEQTAGITSQLADVLRSDTPSNIAQQLAGSFDDLTRGIGDVLTREQLAIVMDGKATDAQLDAVMRAVDLNGDGVMSGLESVIIKSMPTDGALANVLRNQMERTRNQSLSYAEVREALSPVASKATIDRLINRADINADGIITAQELANVRLDGLAPGIGGALAPLFDQIDTSLDGLINYDEFGKQFEGIASDKQLKQIFNQLDVNGDGTISKLEALKHSSDEVGDNTKSIEERALDQVSKLGDLVTDMTASTNQLVSLDSSVSDLAGVIGELNALQQQRAQEERQHERKMAQMAYYNTRQAAGEKLIEQMGVNQEKIADARSNLNQNQIEHLSGFVASNQAQGPTAGMDQEDWERIRDNIQNNDDMSRAAKQFVLNMAAYRLRRSRLNEWEAIVGGHEFSPDSLELSAFAQGGVFTNSIVDQPTRFPMGLMGEAGPEAVVPLAKAPDGRLGIEPVGSPPIPELPLLGQNDVIEILRDVRAELKATREENRRLNRELAEATEGTTSAVLATAEHAGQQREQQAEELRDVAKNSRLKRHYT
ncbi:phage tail length tape measure family protein [Halomonas elongata]|uniref:phage tail length tape measure family protein n=1 Tax=Halomonas elongata TaxID=2746 RepID=UPI00186B78C2|nr:phage tail length tape measure family protein [Halomonas elongata]MBW5801198.1 phage tail length tape measure family protein [Halomonas elongata]